MKKKIIVRVLLVLVITLIIYESYSIVNMVVKSNNKKVLENVKVEDILKDKDKAFAIKVQDNTFNWNDAGTNTDWPSPTTHYYYGTSCVDETGTDLGNTKQIVDIVQFDDQTNTATVTTKKTVYCTIYFAIKKNALELMQSKTDETYLKTAYEGDELTRYIGTKDQITSNYICFGTSNITNCLGNPDAYMYRIIGIQNKDNDTLGLKTNQLKIIKATPVKEGSNSKTLKWATNYSTSYCGSSTAENGKCQWDYASAAVSDGPEARWYLNNTFLNTISGVTGTKNWKDLISNPKWYKGDLRDSTGTSFKTQQEVATPTSVEFKVGLMYATDYYNAGVQNTTNWLFIRNGWNGNKAEYEWTMTRYGYNGNYYNAFYVTTGNGYLGNDSLILPYAVRPVFYLSSNLKLSGDGKATSPFVITASNT